MITYELMPNNPASHPLTGDQKIKQSIELINARRLSAGDIEFHLGRICDLYAERPADVVAPLAQRLLGAVLQLESVRADAIQKVLHVIQERGLWVEPAESAGGRAPGIEPAESYEQFVERNRLTAAELADRERQAGIARAKPLAEHGGDRKGDQGYNCHLDARGNSSSYLLAKLARDKPDYLKRWKSGEFKSVRAACLAAGIIKPQSQLTLTKDPFSSAQRIQEQRSQDWINDLVEALSPGALSATQSAGEVRVFLEGLHPDRLRYVLSSLCSRRPEVFEQLLDDMADEDQPHWTSGEVELPAPIQLDWSQPAPGPVPPQPAPAKTSSNGTGTASKFQRIPEPGFYSASQLAEATGVSRHGIVSAGAAKQDGDEVLARTLAKTPVMVVVRKANPRSERYEVLPR